MTTRRRGEDGLNGNPLSLVLFNLAHDGGRDRISVSDLLVVLPVPPGTSAVLGTPLIFLAAQMMLGRGPWQPAIVAKRSLSRTEFATLTRRVIPWLVKAEKLLRPRFTALACPPLEYGVGLVCLLLALVLALPIPLGNMLPALAISLLALGMLERDGYWILAGLVTAGVAATVVSGVVLALLKAAIFMFTRVFQ